MKGHHWQPVLHNRVSMICWLDGQSGNDRMHQANLLIPGLQRTCKMYIIPNLTDTVIISEFNVCHSAHKVKATCIRLHAYEYCLLMATVITVTLNDNTLQGFNSLTTQVKLA